MVVIWLVDEKRFVREYNNHIGAISNKAVNWTVDARTGYIWLYIVALHSPEVYCYIHERATNELPVSIRSMIREEGKVLGTIELENLNSMNEKLDDLSYKVSGLKVNQVTDK